jgi:hypothetical protein
MVNGKLPLGVLLLVVTVIVEVPLPVTEDGLKLALVREGKPVTLKLTVPAKPFTACTVTV